MIWSPCILICVLSISFCSYISLYIYLNSSEFEVPYALSCLLKSPGSSLVYSSNLSSRLSANYMFPGTSKEIMGLKESSVPSERITWSLYIVRFANFFKLSIFPWIYFSSGIWRSQWVKTKKIWSEVALSKNLTIAFADIISWIVSR